MPIGRGFASVQLEKRSFCAGRDGRLRSESHHREGQWEAAFVAMLLGSCSSQLAEEERSYWIVLAVPSVGVRGRRTGEGRVSLAQSLLGHGVLVSFVRMCGKVRVLWGPRPEE